MEESTNSSSIWLSLVAMNLNWLTVFASRVVAYPFGFVTPVPNVIVYGVFPTFTLNVYTIPGLSVHAVTVKSCVGVILFDIFSMVTELQERVFHSKSS